MTIDKGLGALAKSWRAGWSSVWPILMLWLTIAVPYTIRSHDNSYAHDFDGHFEYVRILPLTVLRANALDHPPICIGPRARQVLLTILVLGLLDQWMLISLL